MSKTVHGSSEVSRVLNRPLKRSIVGLWWYLPRRAETSRRCMLKALYIPADLSLFLIAPSFPLDAAQRCIGSFVDSCSQYGIRFNNRRPHIHYAGECRGPVSFEDCSMVLYSSCARLTGSCRSPERCRKDRRLRQGQSTTAGRHPCKSRRTSFRLYLLTLPRSGSRENIPPVCTC